MNTETEKFIFYGFMPIQITGKIEAHPNPKKNPVEKEDGEFQMIREKLTTINNQHGQRNGKIATKIQQRVTLLPIPKYQPA